MKLRPILLGTLAYLVVSFPLAITWHLLVFKPQYEAISYIEREEPGFALGFLSILFQGILLSAFYPPFFRNI